jgi:hypothetical protein
VTDDSEQDLGLFPNRSGFSYRDDFGGNNMLCTLRVHNKRPLLRGLPKLIGKTARLLMAAAPLLRQKQCKEEVRKTLMKNKGDGSGDEQLAEFEGPEGDVLRGDQDFTGEGSFGGAAAKGLFGGDEDEIGIIVFGGDVREYEVTRCGVEPIGVGKIFADGMIGKMAGAGKYTLFHDPGIRANF